MESLGLELNFKVFRLLGAWNSSGSQNGTTRFLYFLYTIIVLMVIFIYLMLLIVDTFFQKDITTLVGNLNISCVVTACYFKIVLLLIKHKEIIEMMKILELNDCKPNNEIERDILHGYKDRARFTSKMFLIFSAITVSVLMIAPFTYNGGLEKRNLLFRVRGSHDEKNLFIYVITNLHDLFLVGFGMPLNASFDTLIAGLMVLTCGQYELLYDRLRHATTYSKICNCVRHHQCILKFSKCIDDLFGTLVFVQCFMSMIIVCCLIYIVALMKSVVNRFESGCFLSVMLVQLLLYCWNGNEVFSMSQGVATSTLNNEEWCNLSIRSKKALLMMSIRSYNTEQLKASSFLNLSLTTYMMILKTSYSMFTLLQQVSSD
uniref:Odorant receptor n=1 Tax=Sirex nitobei TaxID=1602346 RepID=A0A857N2N0_9HYME|nr:odorant receptor 38 [Sirex nitobei]